jgi:hypothetical protein
MPAPPPPTQKSASQSGSDFSVKQVANEPDTSEQPDPFDLLPTQPDPNNQVTVLAQDVEEPVTVSIDRVYPKNHSTGLDNIKLVPAHIPEQITPSVAPQALKQINKSTIKAWEKWVTDIYRGVRNDLYEAQREELNKLKADYKTQLELLGGSLNKDFREDERDHKNKHDWRDENDDDFPWKDFKSDRSCPWNDDRDEERENPKNTNQVGAVYAGECFCN